MSDLVGNEILVKRKPIFADNPCENRCGFVGAARADLLPTLNENRICEVLVDCASALEIGNCSETQSCRFHGGRGCRNPPRARIEKLLHIGIRECDWFNSGASQLQED